MKQNSRSGRTKFSQAEQVVLGLLDILLCNNFYNDKDTGSPSMSDDSWVPTSGSPPCWRWGYQSLKTGSKWAAIFPLA